MEFRPRAKRDSIVGDESSTGRSGSPMPRDKPGEAVATTTSHDAYPNARLQAFVADASDEEADDIHIGRQLHHDQPQEPQEEEQEQEHGQAGQRTQRRRRYKSRTCRICLEVVHPTFEAPAAEAAMGGDDGGRDRDGDADADGRGRAADMEIDGVAVVLAEAAFTLGARAVKAAAGAMGRVVSSMRARLPGIPGFSRMPGMPTMPAMPAMPAFLNNEPRVRYVSEDPADGRLISPCRCRGTQKYVHEGCLQAWRLSQAMSDRHYWTCPTCGFAYRLERLRWSRWIAHKSTRVLLTLATFWVAIFLLGFVSDPLIDLWLDPGSMLSDNFISHGLADTNVIIVGDGVLWPEIVHLPDYRAGAEGAEPDILGDVWDGDSDGLMGWVQHFIKGFLSLGIVGIVKTFVAVSPFTWWNIRAMGGGRARRRAGGRARVEGLSWLFVVVGAFTFMGVVWKGIGYVCRRFLEHTSERIVDIQADGNDSDDDAGDDSDVDDGAEAGAKSASNTGANTHTHSGHGDMQDGRASNHQPD